MHGLDAQGVAAKDLGGTMGGAAAGSPRSFIFSVPRVRFINSPGF
jgi:hypothetical protein